MQNSFSAYSKCAAAADQALWQRVPLHGSVVLNLSWKYFDCCAFTALAPPSVASPFSLGSSASVQIMFHTPPGHGIGALLQCVANGSTCSTYICMNVFKLDSAVSECQWLFLSGHWIAINRRRKGLSLICLFTPCFVGTTICFSFIFVHLKWYLLESR